MNGKNEKNKQAVIEKRKSIPINLFQIESRIEANPLENI